MKKALCLILALILTCALMPAALAEYEPPVYEATEGTPYGIPLPTSVDDIDFAAVINGHTYRRLLDLVDNIEVKSDMHQEAQGQTFDMLIDDYYFLDNGQYVSYSEQTDKTYNSMSYQLFLYDKDDPYYYVRHMGGRDKYEAQAEYIDMMLDNTLCPLSPNFFDFNVTSAEEVDGLYVYAFEMTPRTDLGEDVNITVSYSDCSLKVDPATGLIRGFGYDQVSQYGEQIISAEVNYNVDKEPDYSIKY